MKITENCIVLFDFRGRVGKEGSDSFSRHLEYANKLFEISDGEITRLVILQFSNDQIINEMSRDHLSVITSRGLSRFKIPSPGVLLKISKLRGLSIKMLVIGDGHVTFLLSLIPRMVYKVLSKRNIPLQVQIHHEVVKRSPTDGIVVFLKYLLTKFAIKSANSVRVTTNSHSNQVEKAYGCPKNKLVAVPVRINLSRSTDTKYPYPRNKSIGIVGRLHRERDLQISFKVIKLLNEVDNNFKVLVLGEGPEENSFREELTRELGPERVAFLGYLTQGDFERAWMKIGVLLSTAREESFGRTIRESLCRGVPVLVEKSLGAQEASAIAPRGWLSFINHPLNQAELFEQFSALLGIKTDDSFANFHDLINAQIPEQLVVNWLNTIKNSS